MHDLYNPWKSFTPGVKGFVAATVTVIVAGVLLSTSSGWFIYGAGPVLPFVIIPFGGFIGYLVYWSNTPKKDDD